MSPLVVIWDFPDGVALQAVSECPGSASSAVWLLRSGRRQRAELEIVVELGNNNNFVSLNISSETFLRIITCF